MSEAIERDDGAEGDNGGRRAAFVTFGCRLNKAEALDLEAQYAAAGWQIVALKADAHPKTPSAHHPDRPPHLTEETPDVIIVRGCSVTAKAQRDCEKAIAHLRARFPAADIRITGCLPEEFKNENVKCKMPVGGRSAKPNSTFSILHFPFSCSRAYLKVQDGCSGRCAYCIVPQFRGSPVSVPFDDVLARARTFLAAGFREIVLTGCNLSLYRSAGHGIPDLAAALAALESPGHRIRLGSIEPGLCDAPLLDALEAHPNICRFLHLSLQSGSNPVLARMRRPYTAEHVRSICAEARKRLGPRIGLGADIIAGFPGETDDDHKATLKLIRDAPLIHTHVFPYSERPGTEAANMTGALPPEVRRQRAKELERAGEANRADFAQMLIGEDVTVCVERDGNGRTDEGLRCILEDCSEFPVSSLEFPVQSSVLYSKLETPNSKLQTLNSKLQTLNSYAIIHRLQLIRNKP